MRALVCGAGIAGLTAAWWLERYGWQVTIVEQDPGLPGGGYLLDFGGPGYDVLDQMGLLPALEEIRHDIPAVVFVDPTGRSVARMSYHAASRLLDGRLANVLRGDLTRLLLSALNDRIDTRLDTSVTTASELAGTVRVGLSDGSEHDVDLLVGADGVRSHVRRLVFGPDELYLRPLDYQIAAYQFRDDDLADHLGPEVRMLTLPGRQAGFYRLPGGRIASFLAHHTPGRQLPRDPVAAINAAYAGMGWIVDDALAHCPEADQVVYDTVAQVEMPTWNLGHTVLIGDAAMAVSPLAGQGASLAATSAYLLARELRHEHHVPSALARYQRDFAPEVDRHQRTSRRAAAWIAPTTRWQIALRDTALRAASLPGMIRLLTPVLPANTAALPAH